MGGLSEIQVHKEQIGLSLKNGTQEIWIPNQRVLGYHTNLRDNLQQPLRSPPMQLTDDRSRSLSRQRVAAEDSREQF
eukprot:5976730-Amphidinium_carterae.1